MLNREARCERLCEKGVVAVVRAASSDQLLDVARALLAGGVDCIEITMTTPNALEVIADCRRELDEDALVGVGSVLSADIARSAVDAGAEFVVSPIFKPEIIDAAHAADLPCVPGAFTPTEVQLAHEAGADIIKVFPGGAVGPSYLKALLGPLPHLKLSPTGGVNLETAADWIAKGACTLGIGSALVTRDALATGDTAEIERRARRYVDIVAEARSQKAR
jgi:2-dehydro-3-deoxyphosphogluconate aldolase/(4S)-4-hydroxy-2-oxoglutarate aldolase